MRTLGAVVLALLVLAPLAAWAARGRRARWAGEVEEAGRSTLQTFAEGLIVLAVVVIGVVIVVALFD